MDVTLRLEATCDLIYVIEGSSWHMLENNLKAIKKQQFRLEKNGDLVQGSSAGNGQRLGIFGKSNQQIGDVRKMKNYPRTFHLGNWKNELPLTKMRQTSGYSQLREKIEFSLGQIRVEMIIGHNVKISGLFDLILTLRAKI